LTIVIQVSHISLARAGLAPSPVTAVSFDNSHELLWMGYANVSTTNPASLRALRVVLILR